MKNSGVLTSVYKATRSQISKYVARYGLTEKYVQFGSEEASLLIKEKLLDPQPLMVARYGYTELYCMLAYLGRDQSPDLLNKFRRLLRRIPPFGFNETIFKDMEFQSGFINANAESLREFSELMLDCTSDLDVLGSWLKEECFLERRLEGVKRVHIFDLEPFHRNQPWTEALRGKNVLVIHPFAETIMRQYEKREFLFEDKRILPDFNLKVIKAVQSVAGNKSDFHDWFSALDYMKKQIDLIEFDVAILGCGAYGFPLASYIKRERRGKAIHLGGATQLLFGIMGKRWEQRDYILKIRNEHWCYPSVSDRPPHYAKHDGSGSYW